MWTQFHCALTNAQNGVHANKEPIFCIKSLLMCMYINTCMSHVWCVHWLVFTSWGRVLDHSLGRSERAEIYFFFPMQSFYASTVVGDLGYPWWRMCLWRASHDNKMLCFSNIFIHASLIILLCFLVSSPTPLFTLPWNEIYLNKCLIFNFSWGFLRQSLWSWCLNTSEYSASSSGIVQHQTSVSFKRIHSWLLFL